MSAVQLNLLGVSSRVIGNVAMETVSAVQPTPSKKANVLFLEKIAQPSTS